MVELCLYTEQDTARLASIIAACLRPVDCLTLTGNLGAGKTTLMRYLIGAMQDSVVSCQSSVVSPSFMIVQEYEVRVQSSEFRVQETKLYHVDGYRLNSASEIPELGLEECFETGIVAIEWPEIFANYLPKNRLELTLELGDNGSRNATITGKGIHETSITQLSQEFHGSA
jgi:tRNA threonylcarbamoyl adenosine modification protein YjeE